MKISTLPVLAALFLSGCAHTPDVSATYYLPKSSMSVSLIRTVSCTKGGDIVMVSTLTAPVVNTADTSDPKSFSFRRSNGAWTDTDIKLEFFPDQRLKSVNSTSTGQGEAAIKAIASVVTLGKNIKLGTKGLGPQALAVAKLKDERRKEICDKLRDEYPKDPLTLKFSAAPKFIKPKSQAGTPPTPYAEQQIALEVEKGSEEVLGTYISLFGQASLNTELSAQASSPLKYNEPNQARFNVIYARQPALVSYYVDVKPCDLPCIQLTEAKDKMWAGKALIAQLGTDYEILIPRGKIFGKNGTGITFDESGKLSSIQYIKNSGAAAAANSLQAATDSLTNTQAEALAAMKTEADLIAAHQRLVKCKTTATCS